MKKVILVVEDDEFLLDSYRVKLSHEQFEILLAQDGQEAMDWLGKKRPDLIILDLMMPKIDGLEVLSRIRKSEEWKMIPVVVASNLDAGESVDKAMKLGANDYFIKSEISINDLVEKCKKYLK